MTDEKKKILIVDDDVVMRRSLTRLLSQEKKYDIEEAADGTVAEKMINEFAPDLIILDIKMPQKDGYEVLWSMKEQMKTQHIKVIGISGFSGDTGESIMTVLGADAFFEKPFEVDELKEKIEELIG